METTLLQKKEADHRMLIYDSDCPLCDAYTSLFVYLGLLSPQGKKAYQHMDFRQIPIQKELARNRIALFDPLSGEVKYGIDALAAILSRKFPMIVTLLAFKPLYYFMDGLYAFISYNRKIIIPVSCTLRNHCNPDRNLLWRLAFVLFALLMQLKFMSAVLLFFFPLQMNALLLAGLLFAYPFVVQTISFFVLKQNGYYHYAGHLAFLLLAEAVLWRCIAGIFHILGLSTTEGAMLCAIGIGYLILREHQRRLVLGGHSSWLGMSLILTKILICIWLLYR